MEYDILNELMTGTVAQLFTNRGVHQNFFRTSRQSGQTFDLPIDSERLGASSTQPLEGMQATGKSSDFGTINFYNTALEGSAAMTTTMEPAEWLATEAKARLDQAMLKLDLDAQKIAGKGLLSMNIDELSLEKKKVKNELKIYDTNFMQMFSR